MTLELATAEFAALGTTIRVLVTQPDCIVGARELLGSQVDEIDRACSRFRDDSDLSHVNERSGHWVGTSALFLDALEVAIRAARLTDGDVDPTVGEALQLLGYDRDFATVAANGQAPPFRVARVPGWQAIEIDRDTERVRVPRRVQLDLGATAKAFAADRAARAIETRVGCGVLVSLGGDIAIAGEAPADGWSVLVADDHAAALSEPGETIALSSGGLATSSTSVRRWSRGQHELHHIVDPATGQSAEVCWRTVSVAASSCVDANIASTAAIVRGADAPAWLASLALPARLVARDGRVRRVGGWPEPPTA